MEFNDALFIGFGLRALIAGEYDNVAFCIFNTCQRYVFAVYVLQVKILRGVADLIAARAGTFGPERHSKSSSQEHEDR